ncbi:NUDIX hydrolase [Candidatus Planktophila versatilis]|uniref:NUDIX hydrolase n=1 Tax=Candidatus Planktophila versatilis TaxID=1884905 RepID=UPI003CEEE5A6
MIRAAGALLWRDNSDLSIEVALIHRPRYDDWSLPKGKLEMGETALQCAYREVHEETGIRATFTRQLGTVEYEESGQEKRVKYWAAHCALTNSEFVPNEEVDQMRWLSPSQALEQATHNSDKSIIEKFMSEEQHTDTLIILRHTKSLERGDWDEADSHRTLDETGFDQAQLLIKHLAPFAIDELYTSDYTRCVQTVTPLAHARGLSITAVPSLNEESFELDPEKAISFANALKQDEKNILICSHNPVIPSMLRGILNTKLKNKDLIKLEPGDAWIVHRVRGEIVGLDYLSISN